MLCSGNMRKVTVPPCSQHHFADEAHILIPYKPGLGQGHNQKKDTHTVDFDVTLRLYRHSDGHPGKYVRTIFLALGYLTGPFELIGLALTSFSVPKRGIRNEIRD
jgi:hypothetical protein